jgi:3' terminal RNA ribose 2'-O-methyltransferase Hen1
MLLTITTTHRPATDLGYLLHKNPSRSHSFELSFGQAHVFYPEASAERCTAALLLDVDPVGLVRNRKGPSSERGTLDQYVNDRPYVASSLLSVAIARVFGSALAGRSKNRSELAITPIPLKARISVLPCRGGEGLLRRLFEPLGYQVMAERHSLDPVFPEWGERVYYDVELSGELCLHDLLTHIYVYHVIPVAIILNLPTSSACEVAGYQSNDHWRCVNLRWASRRSNASSERNRCVEFMNVYSACSHWKANLSIRACDPAFEE